MTWGAPFLASFARNGNFVFADRESRAYGKGETPQAREGHEFHQCHISPARVERTLLSAAFDLDLDFVPDLDLEGHGLKPLRRAQRVFQQPV